MKPRIQVAGRRPKKPAAKRSIHKSLPRIVYVIELDAAMACLPKVAKENPRYVIGMPCFYVGSTTQTAEERFLEHISGHKNASEIAHRYGLTLRIDLMPPQKPIRREWALNKERRRARELRAQGCAVWQK